MSARSHSHAHLTECGLPGIRAIPYGVHMCHFYDGRDALAKTLGAWFDAGLRHNERCIWITANPLDGQSAEAALKTAGCDVHSALRRGALLIRDHFDWYGNLKDLDVHRSAGLLLEQEERALADGYSGLRTSVNTAFVSPADWDVFMEYEERVDQLVNKRRIVSLCSYPLRCGAAEMLEVVRRHGCTLDQPDEGWRILTARRDLELASPVASALTES